ncbi:YbcC family protein [Allorhizobium pseudoryzae]|uniref:YbcC family protein n=1 Tax=Allorhizobium pseudoryzae TaxID=379684 RepID=UPI003CFCCB40
MDQVSPAAPSQPADLSKLIRAAVNAVPPAWPLSATVAVNPFLGQVGRSFAETAEQVIRLSGVSIAMPRAWYAGKIAEGTITQADLAEALADSPLTGAMTLDALKAAALREPAPVAAIPTIADLARTASGIDWPRLVEERIGAFAAGHFDEGQALWTAPKGQGLYAAWRIYARHDLTPEIAGLKGFAQTVADLPRISSRAIAASAETLGIGTVPGSYFHQLLLSLGGWAQYARHLDFTAERDGRCDETVIDLLAIRLAFEEALYRQYEEMLAPDWQKALAAHRAPIVPSQDREIDAVLQAAAERAEQRRLAALLAKADKAKPVEATAVHRSAVQAAFCIDVRSEVFRRAFESADAGVATLGFAGFFGLGAEHRGEASDLKEHRLPVLLKPGLFSCTEVSDEKDRAARIEARAVRAFGRFKQAAVSSFAFVEAMGPVYAAKLLAGALKLGGHVKPAAKPRLVEALSLEQKVGMAATVLKAMSLTEDFARIVLICGHGASVTNNPLASALQCGACGGHAGDVNARLLATLLNEEPVRQGLVTLGIAVPQDTLFLAGLHDTTTDAVTLFDADVDTAGHAEDLARLKLWLASAGRLARAERSRRLAQSSERSISARSRDWSEVRPEWGLAGCSAFIAAPRRRTASLSLDGRSFLHDYVWRKDEGFKVLELILTAPVVVASWISLQYFGSATAPSLFGAGNKLLHNVVGGIGVLEGNGGLLRAGLAWQSVHDGEGFAHDPLRLWVVVEAPKHAINEILARHPSVKALFDNGWLSLFILNEAGEMAERYSGDLAWSAFGDGGKGNVPRKAAG